MVCNKRRPMLSLQMVTDMDQVNFTAKHIVLAKFNEGVEEGEIERLIRDYADLSNHIEQIQSFEWGKDTLEDRSAYGAHPAHVKFDTQLSTTLEKVVVIDYVPRPEP
uniref:Stress-response A/B barrel domain-containing protein n=1 Tax=Salix viminalis TaxID=40686 RepID=A0A6N2NBV6_SALVM